MDIVKAGKQDKRAFQGLMQRYLHDLSPYTGDSPDAHGHYDFGKYFDAYWEHDDRHPYLFLDDDGQVCGFTLVRELSKDHHSVAEFYIDEPRRRAGLGRKCAKMLFRLHPGRWSVAQMEANGTAIKFWRRVIGEVTGGNYSEQWSDRQPHGPKQEFNVPAQQSAGAAASIRSRLRTGAE